MISRAREHCRTQSVAQSRIHGGSARSMRNAQRIPAPAPLIELAAIFLRTESELVLKSRRVIPRDVCSMPAFTFKFPTGLKPPKTW